MGSLRRIGSLGKYFVQGGASQLPERVTGSDMMQRIAIELPTRVYLLGGSPGAAEKAAKALTERGATIVGTSELGPEDRELIIEDINATQPDTLFVGYGAPKQELFLRDILSQTPSVRIAIGIGAGIDFLAGKQKRSPALLRKMRLEWLWRLMLEPRKRGKRIWTAVWTFPTLVTQSAHDQP